MNTELQAKFNNDKIAKENSKGWNYLNYKIDRSGNIKNNPLPFEYQEVEFLRGTGSQYIDTLLNSNRENFEITIDFQLTKVLHNRWIFGTNIYEMGYYGGFYKGSGYSYSQEKDYLARTIAYIKKNMKDDKNFYIFARNWPDNVNEYFPSYVKIYSVEILKKDELVRNFIPCYSTTTVTNADGKTCPSGTKGMYDLVEGKFYTNQGSGDDFIAGPEV